MPCLYKRIYKPKKEVKMKNKLKLTAVFLFGLGLTNLQAQNSLYVLEKSGAQTQFALSDIKTLTFPSGNLLVNKKDGNSNSYARIDLRQLNFVGIPNAIENAEETENKIVLFPNPVNNELKISLQNTENTEIEIIDLQGRILQKQIFNIANTELNINVSQLTKGLYFCKINNGKTTKTIKFLKN
jgi:hypothetical protein